MSVSLLFFSALAALIEEKLMENSIMLNDYFSLEIDNDGRLCTIPMLLPNFVPHLGK